MQAGADWNIVTLSHLLRLLARDMIFLLYSLAITRLYLAIEFQGLLPSNPLVICSWNITTLGQLQQLCFPNHH